MNVLWIFFILIFFCIYVLLGLYITEGLNSSVQVLLAWVVYTIMWTTFLNVFILGYFWSVIQNKKGPVGQRGPSGETGIKGIEGSCGIDATEAFLIKALSDYIDALYHAKTNNHIINDKYKFTNRYLNNKIGQTAGSRQYKVLVANLSKDNKPVINLINYLKSIWKQWFELIYDATAQPGSWFTDEFGDDMEDYGWLGPNPFIEIRKYDVYYWGITRNFRPLKAEICRSTAIHGDNKFPHPQLAQSKYVQAEPRLKIIQSNDYYPARNNGGGVNSSDHNPDGSFWSPNTKSYQGETYYPVGDIFTHELNTHKKNGPTIFGNSKLGFSQYTVNGDNGPDMKTILVSGDVVDPVGYQYQNQTTRKNSTDPVYVYTPICPDGYTNVGLTVKSWDNDQNKNTKCVPTECVDDVKPKTGGKRIWYHHYHYFDWSPWPSWEYDWRWDLDVIDSWKDNKDPSYDNNYNFFRLPVWSTDSYKGIKKSCLERVPNVDFPAEPQIPTPPPATKEVEKEFADLGIGWYGHPYKLDPKYSIFTYINLVPEGIIVNKGTGERFYIVHVEGNDINLFNILAYNTKTTKYDGSLQAMDYNTYGTGFSVQPNNVQANYIENGVTDQNVSTMNAVINYGPRIKRIEVTTLDTTNISQQWKIILNPQNKKILKLKNVYKNTYLHISQDPKEGFAEFTTIDIDNDNYKNDPAFSDIARDELDNRTDFSFIPSFGTHLNIIDNDNQ